MDANFLTIVGGAIVMGLIGFGVLKLYSDRVDREYGVGRASAPGKEPDQLR